MSYTYKIVLMTLCNLAIEFITINTVLW